MRFLVLRLGTSYSCASFRVQIARGSKSFTRKGHRGEANAEVVFVERTDASCAIEALL